ncbi:RNA polymerase sigma factor [Evansella cellulosilytica]|uniref:RNA polymerase, sigma-24 subunit, ECF subfamily n=1 Tax=Evansella cellulosilytica (strain ATCC 21833 / DSM 2522 / FERM P-1141 / JCM 9156 / N-4) TaxID=649639 RepID=E6TZT0_EVAC2|nr:RNA polymerase sigma factor [Evansella cellulosilytica]ADU31386.1 RNA polymerase, sigma-24 subunit, ECF subfamily [Evansella cellulosilytica DSM 2522]
MNEQINTEEEIRLIYRQYFKEVYHFIVSFTNNHDEAEDLTQEVFIRLFKSISKFKGESELKTFIFSIARNVAVDHYRKIKRRMILGDLFLNFVPSNNKSTEEIVEHKESISKVYNYLQELKPSYRMIVILRGINEFSIKETATILNCSETNIKVSYHRALKLLRQKMVTEGDSKGEGWLNNGK